MIRVVITTPIPSPYQVELFDAIAASNRIHLTVLYSFLSHPSRSWQTPEINHDFRVLSELGSGDMRELVNGACLAVFSGYARRQIRRLIYDRAMSRKPWAYWGERPGTVLPALIGRAYRAAVIPELYRPQVSIWGIGNWAVDAYRQEYGSSRNFLNVPYYSRLDRFLKINRQGISNSPRKFIFSGSLIKRKGIDLLAEAFVKLAHEFTDVELHILGDGPLRGKLAAITAPVADRVFFHCLKP